jgi:hypothetical protein
MLSRFWYVVLGLVLGVAVFTLYLAQSMYNRAGARTMGEGLSSDSQFVSWYLKDDARIRSAHLVKFALDGNIAKGLRDASASETALKSSTRDQVRKALKEVNATIPEDQAFDAVFAIDQNGRVVAHLGYEQATGMEDFELGGYPVVADALHGYVRDDTLVWDRMYRVVARPVEYEVGSLPAGAIVGARIVDDRFARELTARTGAAVAFYVGGQRVAAGAPEGFAKANLDQIVSDLDGLKQDKDYQEKGRSAVREIGGMLGVQYTRLPGESYELGAGYVVARQPQHVDSPLAFFKNADDKDKAQANVLVAGGIAVLAVLVGLLLSFVEHSRPLGVFKREAREFAQGKIDQLQPSKFRGAYRQIASDLNDGVDKVAAQGGHSRRAADLEQVLGELPAQPQMSAFSVPGGDFNPPTSPGSAPGTPFPSPASAPQPARPLPRPPGAAPLAAPAAPAVAEADPEAEWHVVFQQFVATKQQCGESIEGFTYDKFRKTLVKNREALVSRGAAEVRFSVYIKDGKAALKANPIR